MAARMNFSALTVEERLELIGEIWDSVDQGDHPAPSTEVLAELERRVTEAKLDAGTGRSWESVRDDIVKRLG